MQNNGHYFVQIFYLLHTNPGFGSIQFLLEGPSQILQAASQ